MGNRDRRSYQTDVTDEEWSFVAPYLALCREDAVQREYPLRSVFNALRYIAKTGCHWRMLPNDLPPSRPPAFESQTGQRKGAIGAGRRKESQAGERLEGDLRFRLSR
jgi:transposase